MTSSTDPPLILVADDDDLTRELTRSVLVEGGFRVEEAHDGEAAVAQFTSLRPDLVIMDVMMPKLDGFGGCKRMREIESINGHTEGSTPIIMLTALDDVDAVSRAFDAGATDFISKPIHWPLFIHRVRYAARTHRIAKELGAEKKRLEYVTNYDAVTNLANRTLINDRLDHAVVEARRHPQVLGVILIDIDRFKIINDSYGHELGNTVLKQIANRLHQFTRESDTLGRIGGDEFIILAEQLHDPSDASRIATTILDALKEPFEIDGMEIIVTASLGIATYPLDGLDSDTLIKNAEAAMYQAKSGGRDGFQFFTESLNQTARERLSLETQLRHALDKNEFFLCYQPQMHIADGTLWGAEALIRWRRPGKGIVAPDAFVPIMEDTGIIMKVGEWIVETACTQILLWQEQGFDMAISINLSARQFGDGKLVDTLLGVVRETGIDPCYLELELTESTLMKNASSAIETMRKLKDNGIRLSIDDFGTGYSSLAYLKKLPVNHLKVDKSFVLNMSTDEDDKTIVRSTIDLAHNLGLGVIAEGVENIQTLKLLKEMNCDLAQGFFIGRPLEANHLDAWLAGYAAH